MNTEHGNGVWIQVQAPAVMLTDAWEIKDFESSCELNQIRKLIILSADWLTGRILMTRKRKIQKNLKKLFGVFKNDRAFLEGFNV